VCIIYSKCIWVPRNCDCLSWVVQLKRNLNNWWLKDIQFPKRYVWEDPKWRTVNVESKRVLLCLRSCLRNFRLKRVRNVNDRNLQKGFYCEPSESFYPLKAVPRLSRPRSMKYLAQSQARLCRVCGENIGAGTGLPTSTSVTLSVSFQQYSILISLFIHSSIISPITDSILHIC